MPEALKQLINSISYLPGVGEKSAQKLAFFLLHANNQYIENLSNNLQNIKKNVGSCNHCHALTDSGKEFCSICSNTSREDTIITVVEEYLDMITLEQSGMFHGKYHILGGAVSPINGIFIGDLHFESLFARILESNQSLELILATNPNIEGEATASYIIEEIDKRKLKYKVKVTRLSRGLSSGYIEYADNLTLANAFKERKEI